MKLHQLPCLETYLIDPMPIEIRELVIKTEIAVAGRIQATGISVKELESLKLQVLEECKRLINTKTKKDNYKR